MKQLKSKKFHGILAPMSISQFKNMLMVLLAFVGLSWGALNGLKYLGEISSQNTAREIGIVARVETNTLACVMNEGQEKDIYFVSCGGFL